MSDLARSLPLPFAEISANLLEPLARLSESNPGLLILDIVEDVSNRLGWKL